MLHKNMPYRSDQKSRKRSKVRVKSGNFVMKIEWQPCENLIQGTVDQCIISLVKDLPSFLVFIK